MHPKWLPLAMAITCAGCADAPPENQSQSAPFIENNMPDAPLPDEAETPSNGATPISEGPIDPKSAEGAGQVIQHFAALLEQKRFAEASELGEEDFAAALDQQAEIHAEIGAPGPIEGAAGSLYVQVPIRFYGRLGNGKAFSQRAIATLRRVNDVPGSTSAQRQWRIYKLDMQQPG